MAKQQIVEEILTDDLDGSPADRTVAFSLDGADYEIELSTKNHKAFSKVLKLYIDHGRPVGKVKSKVKATKSRRTANSAAIREWAVANGYEVSPRGRIARSVVDAYNNAH